MGQYTLGLGVAIVPKPTDMGRKWLSNRLVVVQHPYFLADELHHPDRAGISLGTRTADVPVGPSCHQWVTCNLADASLLFRLGEMLGEVGARDNLGKLTFPYVLILLGPLLKVSLALAFQLSREFLVVSPVELDDLDQRVIRLCETLLDRGILARPVPRHPEFGVPVITLFTKRRNQN